MITKETTERIWSCLREIETAENLLKEIQEQREKDFDHDKTQPTLRDAFGRKQHFQFGIPSGENSHRLFRVDPQLADSVIRAHIAKMKADLVSANEQARIELNTPEERSQ